MLYIIFQFTLFSFLIWNLHKLILSIYIYILSEDKENIEIDVASSNMKDNVDSKIICVV